MWRLGSSSTPGCPPRHPTTWPNTEEMALLWIDEALRALGYEVRAAAGGGRAELGRPEKGWNPGS